MLKIAIPKRELFDEKNERFIYVDGCELQLEHSLISLAKWESRWHKPFLTKQEKSDLEIIDYIRCMTLTKNVDPKIYNYISQATIEDIFRYIEDPMTAVQFGEKYSLEPGAPRRKEIITAEIIYYWMFVLGIPIQCEKWHLNRLLTLIRVMNIKTGTKKPMSKRDLASRNHKLNQARRAKHGSRG